VYKFNVGDLVWAYKSATDKSLHKAQIQSIQDGIYTIEFADDKTVINTNLANLFIYYDCNCTTTISLEEYILANQYGPKTTSAYFDSANNVYCNILNQVATNSIL
jgi:hypothetical protein